MLKSKISKILLGIACAMMLLTATAITEAAPPQEEKPFKPEHKIEHRIHKNHEHHWKNHKFHRHHHKHHHHHHRHHHEWKKCCKCK